MSGADATGEEPAPRPDPEVEPLLDRMWVEASQVLAEERYAEARAWVEDAVQCGDVSEARLRIGASYQAALEEHLNERWNAHLSYLATMWVEKDDREDLCQEARTDALNSIRLFELAKAKYGGPDPELATPIRVSVEKFFRTKLRGASKKHRQRKAEGPAVVSLGQPAAGSSDGHPPERDKAPDDPELALFVNAEIVELRARYRARLRLLDACRRAVGQLDLESPDLRVRKSMPGTLRLRRILVPLVLNFLAEMEELACNDDLPVDQAVAGLYKALRDACRKDDPKEKDNTRDQFVKRNRPEALFAASAALLFGIFGLPTVETGSPEARARFDAEELLIALRLEMIKPLTERLAKRITTTDEVGHLRFVASHAWLYEVLTWLQSETSAAAVLPVIDASLSFLRKRTSPTKGSPVEVANDLPGDDIDLLADTNDLLALADHMAEHVRQLRIVAKGKQP